jgi:hypothetical protein
MSIVGPLALCVVGFLLALVLTVWPRARGGIALLGLGILLALLGVAWFLWGAAREGGMGFGLGLILAFAALALGGVAWFRAVAWIESLHERRLFRRLRAALEALVSQPGGAVTDPPLRADGVLSYEHQGDHTYFAFRSCEDNGRTPDVLIGFLHTPGAPPSIGDPIPRSTGRYNEGTKPFVMTRIGHLDGPWWLYAAEEVWDRPQRSPRTA